MRKLFVGLSLLFVLSTQYATADFLIEPFAGYETGNIKDNNSSGEADYKGMAYGLRLGVKMLGLGVGAEYAGGALETDQTPAAKYSFKNMGAFISYDFPVMVRAYMTYFFAADTDIDVTPTATLKGSGYRVGLGFTSFPFMTINVEYLVRNWDEAEQGGTKTSLDYTSKTTMLSLAFPLSF
ncbi:MAG: hypothetical protein KDD43_10415 [Bdellovibrionales bacterium]|nr:hypothetical protein [Bdellovibrionales bacterium]